MSVSPRDASAPPEGAGSGNFGDQLVAHQPTIARYALRLTRDPDRAEDLAQSVAARALGKQHLFALGTDLRAWVLTIAYNLHVQDCRKRGREGLVIDHIDDHPDALRLSTPDRALLALTLRDVRRAFAKLPESQQAVVTRQALGESYEDTADALGVRVNTVRSRLSRGRATLRLGAGLPPEPKRGRGRPSKTQESRCPL